VVSIMGGKLSDCLNVGEEVVAGARECGLSPMTPPTRWYGEPGRTARRRFTERSAELGMDPGVAATLWRRQGMRAFQALDLVGEDRSLGDPMGGLVPFTEAEVMVMADHERIVEPEDFLRRRTMLAQVERDEDLADDDAVQRALGILGVA
jgi:glycerol-3-phosphate dehydrogenase